MRISLPWIFPEIISLTLVMVIGTVFWHFIVLYSEYSSLKTKKYSSDIAIYMAMDMTYGTYETGPYIDKFYGSGNTK